MQVTSDGTRWMLRLVPGEELPDALVRFAGENKIRAGAVLVGIGQLRTSKLGYWNGSEYAPLALDEPAELVSLQGSIAEADGRPSVHLHAALGTREHRTVSGHLLSGTVGSLLELLVTVFPGQVWSRPIDESTGLRTLDLSGSKPA
ncbi:MAG: DUF296 domain-containing protein [Thermoplasmata archaeon]|nr:DUF296 domain-containing protein [Thermoplasmata archaeon]